jgi:hypothetical protein
MATFFWRPDTERCTAKDKIVRFRSPIRLRLDDGVAALSVIFFELNEVPWRVMDRFCERHPHSTFAKLCRLGAQYETVTEDKGELHPWVTWPGVHRGVNNEHHGIAHLGQDLREVNEAFPTLWSFLAAKGLSVGVAGSLQSYPIPANRDNIRFYVPDTYAPAPETIPEALSSFQDVNLRLTKENSRNVARRTSTSASAQLIKSLPSAGITLGTALGIGTQLVKERTDKTKLNRRRAIQSRLYFDAFMKQLQKERPSFSTFFTNHVAATMHRFWAATFPEDYATFDLPPSWVQSYADEVNWAMWLADGFAARLVRFCESNPEYSIVLCTSMGQAATTARIRNGIFTLKRLDRFFSALDIAPEEYRPAMAMAPDVSVHLLSERAIAIARRALADVAAVHRNTQYDIDERGLMHVRIVVKRDPEVPSDILIGNRSYSFEELGIEFVADQDQVATTAYHVPEGILITWSPRGNATPSVGRPSISNLEIAPAVIASLGIEAPSYMKRTSISLI